MRNSTPTAALGWTPRDGETVHFRATSPGGLKTGRYMLDRQAGEFNTSYWLRGVSVAGVGAMTEAELQRLEQAGQITPISPADLERERQEVALRTVAPLRQARFARMVRQHDASDLALFRAASEPGLGL